MVLSSRSLSATFTIVLSATGCFAQSFDCAKARTKVEKLISSDAELAKADLKMAAGYQRAMQRASLLSAEDQEALKKDQIAWLRVFVGSCKDAACLKLVYERRTEALEYYEVEGSRRENGDPSGTYELPQNELKVMHLRNGNVRFSIVASFEHYVGDVGGEARLTADTAVYEDASSGCKLSFQFSRVDVNVEQKGECGMGEHLTAAGRYRRTSAAIPLFDF